jgi:hypothetical protein
MTAFRQLPQRSVIYAADVRKYCVSEGGNSKVGLSALPPLASRFGGDFVCNPSERQLRALSDKCCVEFEWPLGKVMANNVTTNTKLWHFRVTSQAYVYVS